MTTDDILRLACFKQANRNPYFRTQLLFSHSGSCARCHGSVLNDGTWNAHHTTYDHRCEYTKLIDLKCVEYGAVRLRRAPPCHLCAKDNPAAFHDCQQLIVLMCATCHQILHGHLSEDTDENPEQGVAGYRRQSAPPA